MIGNDVIDIVQSRLESNWKRQGVLEKIFTKEEQLYISQAVNPEMMFWIFWSMKEAAYKIYNRQTKIRAYIPHKLLCCLEYISEDQCNAAGKVSCCGNTYFTKTLLNDNCIHTIALTNRQQWDSVREIERNNIFKDQYGLPYLSSFTQHDPHHLSISNHGRFEKIVC